MSDNLDIWNKFADIDPKFTKPITGKQYKGTSPNPQYVIMCLTELFGPAGKGFGWEVLKEDFQPLGDDILHWCRIRFWHTTRDNCYESYGQTKAFMKTRNGTMTDEDAPKKSLTDAITKAASHLGIAANIFLGRWDDSKYVSEVAKEFSGDDNQNQQSRGNQNTSQQNNNQSRQQNEKPQDQKKTSYAEMKRGLEDIEKDLLDCNTILSVDTCAKTWSHIMKRDEWTKDYIDAARPKFQARRDVINAQAQE